MRLAATMLFLVFVYCAARLALGAWAFVVLLEGTR